MSFDAQPLNAALVGAPDPEIVEVESRLRAAQLAVEVAGVLNRGTYHYTRVWARDEAGDWRVVGGHVSGAT